MSVEPTAATHRRPTVAAWIMAAAVVLIAVNLRPGATSIGPVLEEAEHSLAMSPTVAGVLTALPGLCFGGLGALAVPIARRAGVSGAVALGAVALALGLLARSVMSWTPLFLAFTVLALGGAAIGNILVPAFVKRHFPRRQALMTTLYTTGLAVGATVPTLLSGPIVQHAPGGWRTSIGIWGVTGAVAIAPWMLLGARERRSRGDHPPRTQTVRFSTIARSPLAIALGIYFGAQSMQAYVQFGWLAQIYRDGGLSLTQAALMISLVASMGIPGGLLMPALVQRSRSLRPYVIILGAVLIVGYIGILVAPTSLPWLWALLLGLSGFTFPTSLALITARSRDPRVTAQLSGFTQTIGYLLAAIGPFLIGAIHGLTGGWTVPLVFLMGMAGVMTVAGLLVARPAYVDDQLRAGTPGSTR